MLALRVVPEIHRRLHCAQKPELFFQCQISPRNWHDGAGLVGVETTSMMPATVASKMKSSGINLVCPSNKERDKYIWVKLLYLLI